jgi:hypothetical protein
VDPAGFFTVVTTGGTAGPFRFNQITCATHVAIKGINVKVVSGTGAYAKATGTLRANVVVDGYASRLATGGCDTNQNDPPAFQTTNVVVVGFINLH